MNKRVRTYNFGVSDNDICRVYNYLVENHCGEENGITKNELSAVLGYNLRQLRYITQSINSCSEYDKIVSVSKKCYIISTEEEAVSAIRSAYSYAISSIKKAKMMEKKYGLNGQYVLYDNDITCYEALGGAKNEEESN